MKKILLIICFLMIATIAYASFVVQGIEFQGVIIGESRDTRTTLAGDTRVTTGGDKRLTP